MDLRNQLFRPVAGVGGFRRRGARGWAMATAVVVVAAAAFTSEGSAGSRRSAPPGPDRPRSREELQIVDCLLPGQVRRLGREQTYLSRRRPVRTSADDCGIRGGEYVAYDRANYQTALRVWMESAEAGDPQAQYYVGEIYEKGLGTAPDFPRAAEWYKKAAESGHAPAQTALGFLYEKGLGVSQDSRKALEWYRKASGISGVIMLDSELAGIRKNLEETNERMKAAEQNVVALEGQVAEAHREVDSSRASGQQAAAGATKLEQEVIGLERSLATERRQVADLQESRRRHEVAGPTIEIIDRTAVRGPDPVSTQTDQEIVGRVEAPAGLATLRVDGAQQTVESNGFFRFRPGGRRVKIVAVDLQGKQVQRWYDRDAKSEPPKPAARNPARFGPYHALIIGNSHYASLPPVETAEKDMTALTELFQSRYGFRVTALRNATHIDILRAFNTLRNELGEKDNLVVYYAGHGDMDPVTGLGYWLPVDAEKDRKTNWISAGEISTYLSLLAPRHVLVIADSCYSGAMTRSSLARIENADIKEKEQLIGHLVARRSRTALTSGGLKPVLDSGGGGHSVFARAVLDTLSETTEVLDTYRLWSVVKARVMLETRSLRFEQVPEYAPIQHAGHESGEFFFVPARG